jgi:predicted secreted protein
MSGKELMAEAHCCLATLTLHGDEKIPNAWRCRNAYAR